MQMTDCDVLVGRRGSGKTQKLLDLVAELVDAGESVLIITPPERQARMAADLRHFGVDPRRVRILPIGIAGNARGHSGPVVFDNAESTNEGIHEPALADLDVRFVTATPQRRHHQ